MYEVCIIVKEPDETLSPAQTALASIVVTSDGVVLKNRYDTPFSIIKEFIK